MASVDGKIIVGSEEWCSTMRVLLSGSRMNVQVLSTVVTAPLASVRSTLPMVVANMPCN